MTKYFHLDKIGEFAYRSNKDFERPTNNKTMMDTKFSISNPQDKIPHFSD